MCKDRTIKNNESIDPSWFEYATFLVVLAGSTATITALLHVLYESKCRKARIVRRTRTIVNLAIIECNRIQILIHNFNKLHKPEFTPKNEGVYVSWTFEKKDVPEVRRLLRSMQRSYRKLFELQIKLADLSPNDELGQLECISAEKSTVLLSKLLRVRSRKDVDCLVDEIEKGVNDFAMSLYRIKKAISPG